MTEKISFSGLLIKLIEPVLNGNESDKEYLMIAKVGMIAWNYNITSLNNLPIHSETKEILNKMISLNSDFKEMFEYLKLRKAKHFSEYNQLLITLELRIKEDGSQTLYVESVPVDKLNFCD